MTRSQCSAHIRWADLEISIWRSLDFPAWFVFHLRWSSLGCGIGMVMLLHPNIVPRLMLGQGSSWGQCVLARVQIVLTGFAVHWVSMWSIVSVIPHVEQCRLGRCVQRWPGDPGTGHDTATVQASSGAYGTNRRGLSVALWIDLGGLLPI